MSDHSEEITVAWLNLGQAYAVMRAGLSRALETDAGIGLSESEVLFRLASAPSERLRMSDLADRLLMAQSGITRVVDRLVEQGLVVREQPTDDRRTVHARLTDAGRAASERARAVYVRSVEDQLGGSLEADDVAALRRLMRRILERSGAWDDARCEPELRAT
jgi:DNA-binding MarR family transcriptional regulator